MSELSIIAVGVDETESSRRALAWAAREALRRGTVLQIITAWTWDAVDGAPLAALDPDSMVAIAQDTQRRAVEDLTAGLRAEGLEPPALACEVVQTTATEALIEASRHADLVVVGTHGRGPVRALLLGSVSQSVIKHAVCPVVVMPPLHESPDAHQELVATGH
jgi:nucleotide-binding universal stress UspA family protein